MVVCAFPPPNLLSYGESTYGYSIIIKWAKKTIFYFQNNTNTIPGQVRKGEGWRVGLNIFKGIKSETLVPVRREDLHEYVRCV